MLFAGYVKGTAALAWMPVDLTLVAGAAIALGIVAVALRKPGWIPRGTMLIVTTWVMFAPATIFVASNEYGSEKVAKFWTITLLAALAPLFLLQSTFRRQVAAVGVVVVGAATAAMGILAPDLSQWGRLSALGSNTISTGRAAGAALLVLVAWGMFTTGRRRLLAFLGAALAAVAMVESGSRGPLVAAVAAVAVLAVLGASDRRGKTLRMLALAAIGAAGWFLATTFAGFGAERISATLQGGPDASIGARVRLILASLQLSSEHPFGIGFGGLYDHLPLGIALDSSGWRQYPHNIVVEALTDAGWLAGVALVVLIAAGLMRIRQVVSTADGAIWSGLAIFFVINAMVSGDLNDNRTMFAALSMVWAIANGVVRSVQDPDNVTSITSRLKPLDEGISHEDWDRTPERRPRASADGVAAVGGARGTTRLPLARHHRPSGVRHLGAVRRAGGSRSRDEASPLV
jgi:hypothetical protein